MSALSCVNTTPRKTYVLGNICVLCGFNFFKVEEDTDGSLKTTKFFDKKLKLTPERVSTIQRVVNITVLSHESAGVCKPCYRSVEKVIKYEEEINQIKTKLRETSARVSNTSLLTVLSPKRPCITKRLLRSPDSSQVIKKPTCLVNIDVNFPVKIAPLTEIIQNRQTVSTSTRQPVRRSLGSTFSSENVPQVQGQGEIEISIAYPSGKKTELVVDETLKKLSNAIFKRYAVDSIIDILVKSHPEAVVKGSSTILAKESKPLCKRHSGSVLQQKDYKELLSFTWDKFFTELQVRAPNVLLVISSIISDVPILLGEKKFMHLLHTVGSALHARSQEMSALHYVITFILTHGGCTKRDIDRLCKLGVCVSPSSVHNKLALWHDHLDSKIMELKQSWENGGVKYQIIGDNWDKNIVPSFRTTQQTTISLHLFNVIAVIDRLSPKGTDIDMNLEDLDPSMFIPSLQEQTVLRDELIFLFATAVIKNIPNLKGVLEKSFPVHLNHAYSNYAGIKTEQYPLGLFDCDKKKKKTADMIHLMRNLQDKYVPKTDDGTIVEPIFFGGDRLTDERVQCAQAALKNGSNPTDRLEGFISKIEDFHRLMNFLEAIHKLTYSTESSGDQGTMHYYRNLLNARNVKGKVKNSYRAYKMLYYTILDAICCAMFLKEMEVNDIDNVLLPESFENLSDEEKVLWVNGIAGSVIDKYFFEGSNDIMAETREVILDPNHPENYWISNRSEGHIKCHHCDKHYMYVGSLQTHELKHHQVTIPKSKKKIHKSNDELHEYTVAIFKLTLLHKNLDTAVDMADGPRSVRSALYEMPLYNVTHKVKYLIGSIHLTALTKGILNVEQRDRLVANRFINLQGGKNNNMALDEYVELLNRDSKVVCTGFQTKESIIQHSKGFPLLINSVKHFDSICDVSGRKGFHHLPSYQEDVKKVITDLSNSNALSESSGRKFKNRYLLTDKNIYRNAASGLSVLIHRRKPDKPYHRLRDNTI